MEIVSGRVAIPTRRTGRAAAVGVALAVALSGAFAFGRVSTGTQVAVPREAVTQRIVAPDLPVIRPKGHGAVKVGRTPADGFVRHSVKWG